MPGFIKPQLATLKAKIAQGQPMAHEIKYDGYRAERMPARRVGNHRPHGMISHALCTRHALHLRLRLDGMCSD